MAEKITLEFDPFTLPTAQHRAGLAGLIVLVETMRNRLLKPLPEIDHGADLRIRVQLTEDSLHRVFADLYAATEEEQAFQQKRTKANGQGKRVVPPKREEVVADSSGKSRTVYYYDQVVPRAPFLEALQMPAPWLKLWRDAMWSSIRGVPRTRNPYEQCSEGQPVAEAVKAWKNIVRFAREQGTGKLHQVELAGCLLLGAQAHHADKVPFVGGADEALLLHFWPVVMAVSVPWAVDRDGKRSRVGYLVTVPDVSDYTAFVDDFRGLVADLPAGTKGLYPEEAGISLPEEGALEYLSNLAAVAKARARGVGWSFSVAGAEVYQLGSRRGNAIPLLHTGRVRADEKLLSGYEAIRRRYRHVLFRRQLMSNLLRDLPWYTGFDRLFSHQPQKLFLGEPGRFFQMDLHRKLKLEREVETNA